MELSCYNCGTAATTAANGSVPRLSECDECGSDLHCCKNCAFYDPDSYNDCRENQADRVVDKERSNFCDFFKFADSSSVQAGQSGKKEQALKKLDDLFK